MSAARAFALACVVPLAARADNAPEDETEINAPLPNRSYLRFEPSYGLGDGASQAELELRGVLVYRGVGVPGLDADRLASALGVDLMVDRIHDGRTDAIGVGDLELANVSGVLFGWGAVGGGLALSVPTATAPVLGHGRVQLGPAVFAQVTSMPALTLSTLVETYFAVSGTDGRSEGLRTRIEPGFVVTFPHDWLLSSDGAIDIDWFARRYVVPVNLEVGCSLGRHLTIQAGPEVEIIGEHEGALRLDVRIDIIDP